MKKLLILIALALASTFAGAVNPSVSLTLGGINFSSGSAAPGSCSPDGSYFFVNGTGWQQCVNSVYVGFGGGSGTVTSVTFTGDGTVLSSTPSTAVTTSGTLNAALANAGAGTLLGNRTGVAAAPAYTAVPVLGLQNTTQGTLTLSGSAASPGQLILDIAGASASATTLQPGANAGAVTLTLPITTGSISYYTGTPAANDVIKWAANGQLVDDTVLTDTGSVLTYTGTQVIAPTGGCATTPALKFGATNTVGLTQAATTASIGFTDGTLCRIMFVPSTTPFVRLALGGTYAWSGTAGDSTQSLTLGLSQLAAGVLAIGNGAQGGIQALRLDGDTCKPTSAITLSTSATTICSWSLPASAQTWSWTCSGIYSITAGTSPTFIVGMNAAQAPTSETGSANIFTTATGTSTQATVTSTAAGNQNILTGATVTGTNLQFFTFGTIQASATAGTFAITGTLGGTTPAGTVNVGTSCELH